MKSREEKLAERYYKIRDLFNQNKIFQVRMHLLFVPRKYKKRIYYHLYKAEYYLHRQRMYLAKKVFLKTLNLLDENKKAKFDSKEYLRFYILNYLKAALNKIGDTDGMKEVDKKLSMIHYNSEKVDIAFLELFPLQYKRIKGSVATYKTNQQ